MGDGRAGSHVAERAFSPGHVGLQLLGGSVALERAFAIPGLGFTFIEAIVERDWMMIQNLTLFFGFIFVTMNLIVDILYAYIDPRIRYS